MLKRMILFALVVTAVPAVIMSFPALADEELRITLDGSSISSVTHFKVIDANNPYDLRSYPGPFPSGHTIYHDRDTNVIFKATYKSEDYDCTVKGRTDNIIPLRQGEDILDEVDVALDLDGSDLACVVTLPTPSVSKLEMVINVDGVTLPTVLTVKDFTSTGTSLGYPIEYKVTTVNGTFNHAIYLDAHHSTVTNEGLVCKFANGTTTIDYDGNNNAKVYVSILANSCGTSYTPPDDDGGSEPPPPPPPAGTAIYDCAGLAGIKNNLNGQYYLANTLTNCSPQTFKGEFKGTFDGQGKSIDNISITPNTDNTFAALFEEFGPGSVFTNVTFNNAKVDGGTGMRGLIVGLANGATISNITVNNLTIGAGESGNIFPSGGIAGRTQGGTLITNVHVNTANIAKNGFAGGLVGRIFSTTTITKSSVRGFTAGTGEKDCREAANGECGVGGLVGVIQGENTSSAFTVNIAESSAKGGVTTQKQAGGLVGYIGPANAGKIRIDIKDSYAIVDITEVKNDAAGIIGHAADIGNPDNADIFLNNVYTAGIINLSNSNGGKAVVGEKSGTNTSKRVKGSGTYYDTQRSGKNENESGVSFASAEVTDALKTSTPFPGWSTGVWKFTSGQYPSLLTDLENKTSSK